MFYFDVIFFLPKVKTLLPNVQQLQQSPIRSIKIHQMDQSKILVKKNVRI